MCILAVVMEFRGLLLFLLGLVFGVAIASADGNHSEQACRPECPTWSVPVYNNGTMNCVCGDSLGETVLCNQKPNISLYYKYCMTYNEVNDSTALNLCPYQHHKPDVQGSYVTLPRNVCELNEFMCGGLNRTGLLCSHCKPGLGPAVFSYTLPCLKCLDSGYGWLLYMFLATFPTTVMFLVVIICQLRITTAPMNFFIFVSQVVVSFINTDPHDFTGVSKPTSYLTLFFVTIHGVFNLDFFRYIIPQFCISSAMTTLQALSLEYIIAFYPLFLITVFYICIQLHARDFKPLIYLWKPFQKCCACISQRWSPSESLIHVFVIFLILSYSKFLFVSFNLLNSDYIRDNSGVKEGSLVFYYNATVPYFGTEHLPFALLAISILVIFIALPVVILLLYPTRIFQRFIGCCNTRWHALDAFVDAFQGYYKDGTNGTPDWRYFSGLYLIFRILAIGTHVLPDITYQSVYKLTCYSFVSLFFGLLQPYKERWINYLDSIAFMLLSVSEFIVLYDLNITRSNFSFAYALDVVPLLYLIVYASYKLLYRRVVLCHCAFCCKNQIDEGRSVGDVEREAYTDSRENEPLLTTASEFGGRYGSKDEENTFPDLGNDS